MSTSSSVVYPNGVIGPTGQYLTPEMPVETLLERVDLRRVTAARVSGLLGPPVGVDPRNVREAGWGVILAPNTPVGVIDALRPLLEYRRCSERHVFRLDRSVSCWIWLQDMGLMPGSYDLTRVPFYLLLIGSPGEIPFEFQYLLDLDYAVGRLSFDDVEDYARYAESVVSYENALNPGADPRVTYWAPVHDPATAISAEHFVRVLADGLPSKDRPITDKTRFKSERLIGGLATREALLETLHAASPPSLLVTASHGVDWPGTDRKLNQGALVSQEWGGAGDVSGALVRASDVRDDARIHGLVWFCFACYSAGTPALDDFSSGSEKRRISPEPFLSALPRRLLSLPRGGALAFIGHIDRAWTYSIKPPELDAGAITPLQNCLSVLLHTEPVGLAARHISEQYSTLSAYLREDSWLAETDRDVVARTWTRCTDARNFVVLGDPAVRLRAD